MKPGSIRPRLRPDLRLVRQESDGTVAWLVKDPATHKYFRFGALEAWVMRQLDGVATLDEVCDRLHEELGMRTTPANLDVLVRRLREIGLVERTAEEKSALLMEQVRNQRRVRHETHSSVLRLQFSLGDPDRVFDWMVARAPWFWSPAFVLFSLGLFLTYAVLLALHWPAFVGALGQLYHPGSLTPGFALAAYAAVVLLVLVHELGHGLTCKRFGGEVHDMGAMLLYFMPAFYCNVNDAYSFEKRAHRLWVTFGGGWIELVAATLAAFVWLATEPGTLVNGVALFVAAFGGGLALLLNYNPLIPLDGYYALVDWLELPNLKARSLEYTGALLKRHLLRLDVTVPAVTDRERRVFLLYGVLSPLYTALLLLGIGLLAGGWLVRSWGGWGAALTAFAVLALTPKPRHALSRVARVWWAEKRPLEVLRQRPRLAALLLLVPLLAGFAPWTVRATATVELEPAGRAFLRAPAAARVVAVRAADGSSVQPGDTVLLLQDPELRVRHARAASEARALERRAAAARARGDAGAASLLEAEVRAADTRLAQLAQRHGALALVAGSAGTLVAPRLHEWLGAGLAAGDSAAELWSDGPLRARLALPQRDAGGVRAGTRVRMRFPATGGRTLEGRVVEVEPAATSGGVHALVQLADLPPALRAGMRGRARVDLHHARVVDAVMRAARRTLRLDLLL